jgi:hypothetical protein
MARLQTAGAPAARALCGDCDWVAALGANLVAPALGMGRRLCGEPVTVAPALPLAGAYGHNGIGSDGNIGYAAPRYGMPEFGG